MQDFLPSTKHRIAVGMSGGVDSSVTALLLKEAGYDVHGIFMKNWEETFSPGYCTAEDDVFDAKDVCETIGIPLHTVNFAKEYQARVFQHFLAEYKAGRTPNPDILCNREIKFSELLTYAHKLGADYIATGHYCRRNSAISAPNLFKGCDDNKDQSYFLCATTAAQLESALFPIGHLQKESVREIAEQANLITSNKKDSTGICFIGERDFRSFLSDYLSPNPGKIITPSGDVIGEHQGLMYYTIGQRQGLHIGGLKDYPDSPWFVAEKHQADNTLVVVQGTNNPALFKGRLLASQINWIRRTPKNGAYLTAKVRYRQADVDCQVFFYDNDVMVQFKEKQRAITLGQYVVFYDGDECLGGGVIEDCYDN